MKVLKFGGTSMADETTWKQILEIIKNTGEAIIVVSATSKTTNALLEAADLAKQGKHDDAVAISKFLHEKHVRILDNFLTNYGKQDQEKIKKEGQLWIDRQIKVLDHYLLGIATLGELSLRSIDTISSIGERLSSCLLALCGQSIGLQTAHVDAAEIMHTNSDFGMAVPHLPSLKKNVQDLSSKVKNGFTPILGGFYGQNDAGEITTLGRGGSDYSASLIGAAIDCEEIQIWTDVSGMYTSDPRFIEGTRNIPEITFNEAAELAYFGAKILHPATIQPAVEKNIPVFIKNTFDPDHFGTKISSEAPFDGDIRAIAFKRNINIITISSSRMLMAYGFLASVFATFEKHAVSVDLVTTSEVSVSMSVDTDKNLDLVLKDLHQFGEVSVTKNQTLICLVGHDFLTSKGVAGKVFNSVSDIPVRMISQGSSEINLSIVVDNELAIDAAQKLHATFFH